jgi:uncharacterized protein (TIGR02246 family)
MKIQLFAFVGLAMSFALPTFAQQKDTVDPEVRQQIEAVYMKLVEAHNKGDAAALAALFTQDAVQLWYGFSEGGLASGQQAIEKRYRTDLAAPSTLDSKIIQMFPIGNDICTITEYKVAEIILERLNSMSGANKTTQANVTPALSTRHPK